MSFGAIIACPHRRAVSQRRLSGQLFCGLDAVPMRALLILAACVTLAACQTTSVVAQGRVLSTDGTPIPDALVTIGHPIPPGGRLDSLASVRTDVDGAFVLRAGPVRCALLQCPEWSVEVSKPGYEIRRLSARAVAPDALATVQLQPVVRR